MWVHHLALRTDDVAKLAAFYEGVVGLPVEARNLPRSIWLRAGETLVMVELCGPDEPRVAARSMELIAFSVDASERDEARDRLSAAGVAIEEETGFTMYFRDPDGRRIALSHYPVERNYRA
jgi:catechol 2,3-dioxygenase-like lactoylglutathione lyase family enzyme